MTKISRKVGEGPRTHALVVGVGHYRHFDGGAAPNKALKRAIRGTQLTSPPLSARAFADWLLTRYSPPKPEAPLETLELLVSTQDEKLMKYRRPDNGEVVELTPASDDEVDTAFTRWRDRLWNSPNDVGFFYFCGHGLWLGSGVLLLEDFGEDEKQPFKHAFDFDATYLGLDQCAARRQYFFVDACQTEILDTALLRKRVKALLDPDDLNPTPREGGVFFASAPSRQAYGRKGEVSFFTSLAIKGLDGLGSDRNAYGEWIVRPDKLFTAIGLSLKRLERRGEAPKQFPRAANSIMPMHVAGKTAPQVPFTVWCEPMAAQALARLSVKLGGAEVDFRPPQSEPWDLELEPRTYHLGTTFEKNRFRQTEDLEVTVVTPLGETVLPVEEGE